MHLSVEGLRPWDWSYPVLQYLREWPTPTVIIFDMNTVVKPQQPPTTTMLQWERPSLLDLLAVRFRINFWLDGWGSISPLETGPMHLSVEGLRPWDWSYPVLQYFREWPTPTVVSSLSRVLSLNTNQPILQCASMIHLSLIPIVNSIKSGKIGKQTSNIVNHRKLSKLRLF